MSGRHRWRQRFRHSLRARLITVFVLLALAMAMVFAGGMQRALSAGWRDALRPLVGDYIDRLAAEVGSPPDIERAKAIALRLPLSVRIDGPRVHWSSNPDEPRPLRTRRGLGPRAADWLTRTTPDGHRISFGLALPSFHERTPGLVGLTMLALIALLVALAYAYVRRLLRPLDDIGAGAARFGQGRFDEPIALRRRDELGDLALRVNTMARDISGMLDAKRTLLLALSHELRSPLTRARLNAELLPATEAGRTEREALLRDLGLMRDLISDLLESERLAGPHAALHREPVDLAALAREVLEGLPAGSRVELDISPELPRMALDPTRVRLLLRNLVDNALRYSSQGENGLAAAPPRLTIRAANEDAGRGAILVQVRDFGPGVEEAAIERLAEPFYRTDGARQRATGGAGLGLYLCRLVAEAHGGHLQVRNARPGLCVEAVLR